MLVNQLGMGGGTGAFREMVANHTDGVQSTIIGRTQGVMEENVSSYISNSRADVHQNITMLDSIRGYGSGHYSGVEISPIASNSLISSLSQEPTHSLPYGSPLASANMTPALMTSGVNISPVEYKRDIKPAEHQSQPTKLSNSGDSVSDPIGNLKHIDASKNSFAETAQAIPSSTITPAGQISSGTTSVQEELEKLKKRSLDGSAIPTQRGAAQPVTPKVAAAVAPQQTISVVKEKPKNAQGLPYIAGSRENIYSQGYTGGGNGTSAMDEEERQKQLKKKAAPQPTHQAQNVVSIQNLKPSKVQLTDKKNQESSQSATEEVKERLRTLPDEDFMKLIEKTAKKAEEAILPKDKAKENAKMVLLKQEAARRLG